MAREELGYSRASATSFPKQVVLRHRLPILQEIPDSNYSGPYVYLAQTEGVIEIVRLPSGDRKGEWVFSADTIRSIDKLYVLYEEKPYVGEVLAFGVTKHLPSFSGEPELWLRTHLPSWLRATVTETHAKPLAFRFTSYSGTCSRRRWPTVCTGCPSGCWPRASAECLCAAAGLCRARPSQLGCVRPADSPALCFCGWTLLVIGPDRVLLVPMLFVLNPLVWLLGMWAIFRLIDSWSTT